MQFTLLDPSDPSASADQIYQKFKSAVSSGDDEDDITPVTSGDNEENDEIDENDIETEEKVFEETDDQPNIAEKRRRRSRIARLKRKSIAVRAYEFSGAKDGVSGIVFMEINRVLDLPPEKNGGYHFISSGALSWDC